MNVVFVTGNANKAKYFSELISRDVPHQKVNVPEIQSLDLKGVVIEKAKAAYALIGKPVLVEDTSLVIHSMGKLPGTFIRWFLEEISLEGLCRLADTDSDRKATSSASIAYYDGQEVRVFVNKLEGSVATHPKGKEGFGWNSTFIPNGESVTLGEMDEVTFKSFYLKIRPIDDVRKFLDNLEA